MEIAIRDNRINQIKNIIMCKEKELLKRYTDIHKTSKENEFLVDVLNDYNFFYNEILKQKEKEEYALMRLYEHLNNIKRTIKISDYEYEDLKMEKDRTIARLNNVKDEIHRLLSKLNKINNIDNE